MSSSTIDKAAVSNESVDVLVSGASFAGLATAFWLMRLGYRVTIVEVAAELRRGGTPVDIEGETIDILTRMGLAEPVRAKALPPRRFEFKDAANVTLGSVGGGDDAPAHERYEIHRDDLLDILHGAVAGEVELLFGRSMIQLEDRPDGVSVVFSDGERRTFALVFGCDGNRSNTRKLLLGDGDQFTYFMGGYFSSRSCPRPGCWQRTPPRCSAFPAVWRCSTGIMIAPTSGSASARTLR